MAKKISGVFLLLIDAELLIKLFCISESVSVVGSHHHQGEHDHLQLLCLLLRLSETNETIMVLLFLSLVFLMPLKTHHLELLDSLHHLGIAAS